MVLVFILRVSWICFLLFGRGACLPVLVKGQSGGTGRLGHLGWVPGTGGVGAVRWFPGTGLRGGGSTGSVRVDTGDWASGAGRSGTSGVDVGSSVTAGVGAGSSGGVGSAGGSGSGRVGIGGFTGSSFFAGFPWVNAPTGGAPSSFDPQGWMPSQTYPDFNAWYTSQVPLGMFMAPPALPSSYIIQNGNGYQRGREAFSYSKYTDDVYSPFPLSPVLPHDPESVPVADSQRIKV
ncbi:WAG22 antigen-like isoform X2 [Simochromis diagramma]|uniref:WAG22 antigen-like isoform X2 n=1 Tax=Simochromis diagramma TaxID=43689 RepID=UPI001A7F0D1B|nr:WAG22 antigen-like isoform X2 [Simochromis diagramma]